MTARVFLEYRGPTEGRLTIDISILAAEKLKLCHQWGE